MIAFIFAWLLAMLTGQPAPTIPPAPAAVVASAPAHHPRGDAPTKRVVPPAPVAVTTPQAPTAPTSVPTPGPDSQVCGPGQTPAVDGCAQGQLPEETIGRVTG